MTTTPDISSAEGQACHSGPHGYIQDKPRYLNRLKRIEGQARGISRMVEEDVYCIDILTQISALSSALENVALGLLDDHLRHCVLDAAREGGDEAEAKLKEASEAIKRLVKS
ncbi:metal-sensitive transcriptional regulator [Brachybacterium paraconglomeratum]